MSPLLALSLAILLAGLLGSVVVAARSGETRVLLLTALFGLLAGERGLAVWRGGGAPIGLSVETAADLCALAAGAVGLLLLLALARTLRERDRSEALHWESMEAIRSLGELAAAPDGEFAERIERLLEIGCTRFDLEIGIATRLVGESLEVLALRAPEDYPVERGAVLDLSATHCQGALASERPVAVDDVARTANGATSEAFGLAAYVSGCVRVGGRSVGTLSFGSRSPGERFGATHKDVLTMMAQWLGAELERLEPARARPLRERALPGGTNVNAAVRRAERQLRGILGSDIELALRLDEDLRPVHAPGVPLEAIVTSLALEARDAICGSGRIEIETAELQVGPGGPSAAHSRYATLTVTDSGAAVDPEALSRLFAPASESAHVDARREPGGRLPLSTLYRMLQVCGGDLSVEAESGRGTRYTVFLPLTDEARPGAEAARALRRPRAAQPPAN